MLGQNGRAQASVFGGNKEDALVVKKEFPLLAQVAKLVSDIPKRNFAPKIGEDRNFISEQFPHPSDAVLNGHPFFPHLLVGVLRGRIFLLSPDCIDDFLTVPHLLYPFIIDPSR